MTIPAHVKTIIENQVGDQDAQELGPVLEVFWDNRQDKDLIAPDLRLQYTLRDALDVLLGQTWKLYDQAPGDVKNTYHQKHTSLTSVREDCQREILAIESRAVQSRPGAIGRLTQTAPVDPFCRKSRRVNPNDPAYRGSPITSAGVPGDVNF